MMKIHQKNYLKFPISKITRYQKIPSRKWCCVDEKFIWLIVTVWSLSSYSRMWPLCMCINSKIGHGMSTSVHKKFVLLSVLVLNRIHFCCFSCRVSCTVNLEIWSRMRQKNERWVDKREELSEGWWFYD